jgi:hypothetical protein
MTERFLHRQELASIKLIWSGVVLPHLCPHTTVTTSPFSVITVIRFTES